MFRRHPALAARSGGTSPNARHPVNANDLTWCDVICVMEEKHKSRLRAQFGRLLEHKTIHVLDIPDDYQFMQPELIEQLEVSVAAILGLD